MGRPIRAKTMYNTWLSAAKLGPNIIPLRRTKKLCRVIGTGPRGILIKAPIAVKAVNILTKAMFFILTFIISPHC